MNSSTNGWPPPTNGMMADDLVRFKAISEQFIQHINQMLPKVCASEGHKWDHPEGKKARGPLVGQVFVVDSGEGFGARGHYEGGSSATVFVRTCIRCGFSEERGPVEVSPFATSTKPAEGGAS